MSGQRVDELPDLLSVRELADYLGVHPRTIYKNLSNGTLKLEPLPIGRRVMFSRYQVERLVKRGETP